MSEHPFGGGRRRPARLWKAAALAAHHPCYLAGLLEAFREGENMSDAELAQYLGCPTEALPQLAQATTQQACQALPRLAALLR